MLILALDTTTRAGSLAIVRDGALVEVFVGTPGATHAARLPGDILAGLARHELALRDVDLFAVAVGPGSFTGLRIGIATIQGLAFATKRQAIGVSALDALALAARDAIGQPRGGHALTAAWIDAQRGEVYGCLYRDVDVWPEVLDGPIVDRPGAMLERWMPYFEGAEVWFAGDGASIHATAIGAAAPAARITLPVPVLAPAIAAIGARGAADGLAGAPHAITPLYVRRPDVELARERRALRAP